MARRPDKKELAMIKALSDLGQSPTSIAKRLGRSHHTVIKYLDSEVYTDPAISSMVEKIIEKELDELCLLGAKARANLHKLADSGTMKPIENIALMDRVFQQRRLLEGRSTQNINSLSYLITKATMKREEQLKRGTDEGEKPEQ